MSQKVCLENDIKHEVNEGENEFPCIKAKAGEGAEVVDYGDHSYVTGIEHAAGVKSNMLKIKQEDSYAYMLEEELYMKEEIGDSVCGNGDGSRDIDFISNEDIEPELKEAKFKLGEDRTEDEFEKDSQLVLGLNSSIKQEQEVDMDSINIKKEELHVYEEISHSRAANTDFSNRINSFSHKNKLLHKKRKHKKSFKCRICDTKFIQSGGLKMHMRIHTGEKPFECNVCDTKFTQSGSLKRHMGIHTGEKLFKCNFCDAKFAQFSNLKTHTRIHTGERPFQCTTCDAKFNQSSHLKIHMTIHTAQKLSECY